MRVAVELYGLLRRRRQDGRRTLVEVREGATVGELVAQLGIPPDVPWNASLNGRLAYPSDPLNDGADLVLFPPISGGLT